MTRRLLEVQDPGLTFGNERDPVAAIEGVSFRLDAGETLAIVGESSSGKSVTALALMRLLPPAPSCRLSGRVVLYQEDGSSADLLALPETEMRRVRGGQISMIFQEPMTSLNPVHSVGAQITEALIEHEKLAPAAATARAMELQEGPVHHGIISAPQPEAAEAGADALRQGGNIVDAAVTAAFVQTVVDPQMCGIAGMGCMHLYLPSQGVHTTLDFHGRSSISDGHRHAGQLNFAA